MTPVPNHNIQGFILQTLQGPLNDPNNAKFWIPHLLEGLKDGGKPVLPIKVDSLPVGALQGGGAEYITQTIAGSWAITENHTNPKIIYAIGTPSDPAPHIDLSTLTLNGLENLAIVSSSTIPLSDGAGYQSRIVGQFNTYGKPQVANRLSATGEFRLSQKVCSCDDQTSTSCNGMASDDVIGIGTFNVAFGAQSDQGDPPSPIETDCFVEIHAEVRIDGTGANRVPKVTITQIDILGAGQAGQPDLYFSDITLTNVQPPIKAQGIAAEILFQLNSGTDASDAIVQMLRSQLNSTAHRDMFSNLLTQTLDTALDGIFGPIPAGALPSSSGQKIVNPVDGYYFDRVRYAINDPTGQYYVPTAVKASKNPKLEPFTTDKIDLPDITLPKPLDSVTLTHVSLTNVCISGLSNALIPIDNLSLDQLMLTATGELNALSNPPAGTPAPPATATADFNADAGPDIGQLGPTPATLTVSSTSAKTTATIVTTASGSSIDDLELHIQSLDLTAAADDVHIALKTGASMNHLINQALNDKAVKQQAISGLNDAISKDLPEISAQTTKGLISMIKAQLGGAQKAQLRHETEASAGAGA